jgi:hypothetical protein
MLDPKLEQFKSRFCVAEGKIIDAPVLCRSSGFLTSPRKWGDVREWRHLLTQLLLTQFRDLAAQAREFCQERSALRSEGVGNAGRPMHPQPRV